MNTQANILAPKPLKKKFNKENVIEVCIIKSNIDNQKHKINLNYPNSNPFRLASNIEIEKTNKLSNENPKILKLLKTEINKKNDSELKFDEDFLCFKRNIENINEENQAKEEILSILLTDSTETEVGMGSDRSSMPQIRPHNPIFKNFSDEREHYPCNIIDALYYPRASLKENKSQNEIDNYSKQSTNSFKLRDEKIKANHEIFVKDL